MLNWHSFPANQGQSTPLLVFYRLHLRELALHISLNTMDTTQALDTLRKRIPFKMTSDALEDENRVLDEQGLFTSLC